jgi:hypothetical protein
VRATDGAGNLSLYSSVVTATTLGITVSVSISPKRGGATVGQKLTFTASLTNDTQVVWSAPGGGTLSGQTATTTSFSVASAGVYTVTATSVADSSKSTTATIGITDLAGVFTYHNDVSRDGANTKEYALTTANVATSTFGKLFSCAVDGAVYAQPLWVANVTIGGTKHNVVIVATQHDTAYAFDADSNANPCVPLWQTTGATSLIPAGETWVTSGDVSCGDLAPEIGIVGTPVIDPVTRTIYLVAKTKVGGTITFHQRLHALDLSTGTEKLGGPADIHASVSGTGNGSSGNPPMVSFDPSLNGQRPALLLENGHVIVSWASHCDFGPYLGWVMSYSASSLTQEGAFSTSPNGALSGVWMSGNGPATDGNDNIYLATGNGSWDGVANFGDSIVKLGAPSAGGFPVADYFTPLNQASLSNVDEDLGSGGLLLLPSISGAHPHLLVQAGKEGKIYLVDRDNMGHLCTTCTISDTQIVQELPNALSGVWGSPAYWNGGLFFGGQGDFVRAFSFNAGNSGLLSTGSTSKSIFDFGYPGATPSVSASGATTDGIVWVIDSSQFCTQQSPGCGPAVLHAYDASNLATELWNSSQAASNRDKAGNAVKFTVPTVANGKVYIGTRGADSTNGGAGELDVYGLLPN